MPELVDIPAGVCRMGIDLDEVDRVVARVGLRSGVERSWILKEAPRHEVVVGAFRLGRLPVTNEEFLAYVLATGPTERPSSWGHGTFPLGAANQPVYTVSPQEADRYCAWLAERTGRDFRLPTEAEWEYAATGGDGRQYPWGDEWDPARANTAEAGPLTATPVGIHPDGASPFGVLDLAGNVEEYVADDYRPYPGAATVADDLTTTHGAPTGWPGAAASPATATWPAAPAATAGTRRPTTPWVSASPSRSEPRRSVIVRSILSTSGSSACPSKLKESMHEPRHRRGGGGRRCRRSHRRPFPGPGRPVGRGLRPGPIDPQAGPPAQPSRTQRAGGP